MPAFSAAALALTSALTAAGTAGATTAASLATAGAAGATGATTAVGATTAAGLGGAVGSVGALGSLASIGGQMYYGSQAAAASQKAEELRAKQMELESARARRQAIRENMLAYYTGVNNEAASGASVGQGTSISGGLLGQTESNLSYNLASINSNQAIGQGLFAANSAASYAKGQSDLYGGANRLFSQLATPNTAMAAGKVLKVGIPSIFDRT